MSDIEVCIELPGEEQPTIIGALRIIKARGKERVSFEYDSEWQKHPNRFELEPGLPLVSGPQFPLQNKSLHNVFSDCAPDRWGRYLVVRREKHLAQIEERETRQLFDSDYLLGIHDAVRMGALRFREKGAGGRVGFYLAEGGNSIPPLIDLRKLQYAAARIDAHQETDEDLALVFAPGSSLGGARPKAVVREPDGRTLIAKFERDNDAYPIIRWEGLTLELASRAGIRVPGHRIEEEDGKAILLMDRFDRAADLRVPFISALTMVGASDGEEHSYLEIADGITQYSAHPDDDLRELWRRLVFNILVSNTDDHLRNHGFLRDAAGWVLSPAYDMNPVPADVGPRVLSLSIDMAGDRTASLQLAISTAGYYGLTASDAEQIAGEVAVAVKGWRDLANGYGVSAAQLRYMESAFEHEDLWRALSFV